MVSTERLEEKVKRFSGEFGDEIIGSVRALAEVDVRIKEAMDGIEKLDEELVRKHNGLTDRITDLIGRSAGKYDAVSEDIRADHTDADRDREIRLLAEIRITKSSC